MGLTKTNVNTQYCRIVEGKIYLSTDKDKENPYDQLEGVITDLYLRDDEYKGEKIRKLNVRVTDGGENYTLSIGQNSPYFSSFVSFLKNVDVTQPVSIVPIQKEDKDGKSTSLLVKNVGGKAKAYFTKATPNGLPQWEPKKINGKTVYDKSDFNEFLEDVLVTEIKPQLVKVEQREEDRKGAPETPKTGLKSSKIPVEVEEFEEDNSDLPF